MLLNAERARTVLEDEGIDGVVSSTLENNFYLSGVWLLGQELFPHDGEAYVVAGADRPEAGIMVTSIGEADLTVGANDTIEDVVTFGTFFREFIPGTELTADEERIRRLTEEHVTGRSALEALSDAIRQQGLSAGVVAVDERGADAELLTKLGEAFPDATFQPASQLFRRIRAVKTGEETERLIGALRATEAALRAVVDAFETGVTEAELKALFDRTIVANDAKPGFTLLRFSRGLALGQVPAGDVELRRGDFVFFDVGCDYRGYKSDIGRLISFGEPSAELEDLYRATKAGQERAIELMKPGAVPSAIFEEAVQAVRDAGLPSYQRQHVGHGIGIEFYDMPVLNPASDTPLEAGMIFEVETPYYRLGVGGSFIEDTVQVTDDGAKILTTLDRDLVVVD